MLFRSNTRAAHAAARAVLDNVEVGLAVIDRDGRLGAERSRALDAWFGRVADNAPAETLFSRAPDYARDFAAGWQQVADDFIPRDVALQYGLSGANLRASGVDWDLRRDHDLPMAWKHADWKVWTHPDGDSFARCWVRLQETREATLIVDRLLDNIPAGPVMAKVPKIIKVQIGRAHV